MGKRKTVSVLMMISLIVSIFASNFMVGPLIMVTRANPGNEPIVYDNTTTLNVTITDPRPRINYYDFQFNDGGTWVSKRNAQIDVNNNYEYRFIVNVSSDQGWDDINYINITAWQDNGSEATQYNHSNDGDATENFGGNRNFRLQYENISGTAYYNMTYPDVNATGNAASVRPNGFQETLSEDRLNGSQNFTHCYNITFSFIPKWQFRYAPGGVSTSWINDSVDGLAKGLGAPGNWSALDDTWSWNFWINVSDSGENNSGESITTYVRDEFGVYSYSEIYSVGWPTIRGVPGENASANNITMLTRSNGNYSVDVKVDDLIHDEYPATTISNETISVRGGTRNIFWNFSKADVPEYEVMTFYNQSTPAEVNNTNKTTDDIEYTCDIPNGQLAGEYRGIIRYQLWTQTNDE